MSRIDKLSISDIGNFICAFFQVRNNMGRKDGKRIKNLSGMGQLIMDLNPLRIGSEVYINEDVDVTELMKYLKAKKLNS